MKSLSILALSLLAFFAPIGHLLATALILVIADTISGIMAAKKLGTPITSAGLKPAITKLFVYEVVILLAYLAQGLVSGGIPVMNIVTTFISSTELLSCCENINTITGGTLLSGLLSKLGQ